MRKQASPYISTVNLPQACIDIQYKPEHLETALLKQWESDADLLKQVIDSKDRSSDDAQPLFELHDGPPYANGPIHVGHVLNKLLKDMVMKSKRFFGFFAPFRPGWDCHGLPIELRVEQQRDGAPRTSPEAFRKACKQLATSQIQVQREQFKRLGILADWEHPYRTMDWKVQAEALRSLAKLFDQNLVKRGDLPVHWCFDCQSSLSEYEVEYKTIECTSVYVKFLILSSPALTRALPELPLGASISLLIWTTTPWTLPANQAVAIHPEIYYQLVELERTQGNLEYLIMAKSLLSEVLAYEKIDKFKTILEFQGSMLSNTYLCHPFLAKKVPLIFSDHVTEESGTGLVHIAPAHGEEDFVLGQKFGLSNETPLGADGTFHQDDHFLSGMDLKAALNPILEMLERTETLFSTQKIEHSAPHCWRHHKPSIQRATLQWFIKLDQPLQDGTTLRSRALKAIEAVEWKPLWGKERMKQSLKLRPDWCISRQRTWGLPLPVFLNKKSGEPHAKSANWIREIADRMETFGPDAWFQLQPTALLGEEGALYEKESSVLDVWFDSGITHASTRENPEPSASLYLEGSDQFRGWFMSSLVTRIGMALDAPYKAVMSHGFVVDQEGKKMSKSLGNVVDPQRVIEQYGAETLRAWVASSDCQGEVTISEETLLRAQNTQKKLRNVLRYMIANLYDFNPMMDAVDFEEMLAVDQWAYLDLVETQTSILENYQQNNFQKVYQILFHYVSIQLSATILEALKDRLYIEPAKSLMRRSAQTLLNFIAQALVRWMAPIFSFTAEELWPHLPASSGEKKRSSVFLSRWFPLDDVQEAKLKGSREAWRDWQSLRQAALQALELAKASGEIKGGLEAELKIEMSDDVLMNHWLMPALETLHFWLGVSQCHAEQVKSEVLNGKPWRLQVVASKASKCARCWMRRIPHEAQVDLCPRCEHHLSPKQDGEGKEFVRSWF